jgi:hypothetical protein
MALHSAGTGRSGEAGDPPWAWAWAWATRVMLRSMPARACRMASIDRVIRMDT